MEMEHVVVKTEVQPNGDILLFYVDESQTHGAGHFVRLENITQGGQTVELEESDFMLSHVQGPEVEEYDLLQPENQVRWLDEEIHKLLVFYIDNKEIFLKGDAAKNNQWIVACNTILDGKNPTMCEMKISELKQQYAQICTEQQNGAIVEWPFYDLCCQAFNENNSVTELKPDKNELKKTVNTIIDLKSNDGILVTKKVNSSRTVSDEKVELMLNLYLQHKKSLQNHHSHKVIWDAIALELGEENADYWHKRFLNFKQHYIRMVSKRNESGPEKINWPYMRLFDQIFDGDEEFQQKFFPKVEERSGNGLVCNEEDENNWNNTEKTVLVKYYFDCFHEFQDSTIPNNFLWHEIGRLLEKKPDNCKQKYREMKKEHLSQLMEGRYDLANRIPIEIIFDNIIAQETEIELSKSLKKANLYESWNTEEIDELVQFFYDNIELFKDAVCYYVCWYIVAKKLQRNIISCKRQWEDLTAIYKSIMDDKKENPDMQIDWRYIDIFDRIFDYGMDANLLQGYENKARSGKHLSDKIGVRKIHIKDEEPKDNNSEDDESYDERGFTKRSKRRAGESKAYKILEFYQKNKDKFSCSLQKKLSLWEILARQIGISATQCAHRFRNLKQVYTKYVQREINKPDMPILWPYYALCKKVFGYRAIKSKLKNGKMDSDDAEEWVAKEIKQLIKYFSNNYDDISNNIEDVSKWSALAGEIGKTESACCEKFLELRKSYRKLRTMKSRNPEVKLSWKYFNMMDDIFKSRESEQQMDIAGEIEMGEITEGMEVSGIKTELTEDDDFQYIIVIPEDQEQLGSNDNELLVEGNTESNEIDENFIESKPKLNKWNKRTKKQLLVHYLKYLRAHKGEVIESREMWKEISSKLDMPPLSCRRVLLKLKNQHKLSASHEEFKTNSPYYSLIEKILLLKPKFAKIAQDKGLHEKKTFKDVILSHEKVEQALRYYLEHLEEFLSPRFEKKYVWMELANFIGEPVNKVFNKINYLKHMYKSDISNVNEDIFATLLQEIVAKESILKDVLNNDTKPPVPNEDTLEEFWSDDEIEQLLTWYLTHLDKFKNAKYVRSYLWMESSEILNKSPWICSKKMSEIRTQYRNMVREAPEELNDWRFFSLCQKIYGTGKKNTVNIN